MRDLSEAVERLQAVVSATGLVELNKLVQTIINTLKEHSPYGMFDDILIRHLWDEYCWSYQEGPGGLNGNYEDVVMAFIDSALEKAGAHSLICMTAYSQEQLYDPICDEEPAAGTIDKGYIQRACMAKIKVTAGIRNLDLIGPHRCYVIGGYVTTEGLAFSRYGADSLAQRIDVLVDPDGDLEPIADEVAETFTEKLAGECNSPDLDDFLDIYSEEIKAMLKAKEILPALEDVRSELLAELDA